MKLISINRPTTASMAAISTTWLWSDVSLLRLGKNPLLPGTSPEEIKGLITEQLERFSISNYQLEDLLEVPAAETDPQAEVVQTLAAAVEAITGTHPRVEGSGPACDGWMFITRGFLFRSCLFRDTMHKGLHLCIRGGFLHSLIEVMAHKQGYSRRSGR